MFKEGDVVEVISNLTPYFGWVGKVELIQVVYSRAYLKDVNLYRIIFSSKSGEISYSFREAELIHDKKWLRDKRLKSLGL